MGSNEPALEPSGFTAEEKFNCINATVITQKSFTVDFLEKKIKPNEGEVPQYYIEHSHEAIIPPEDWQLVQLEMARRKSLKRKYSGNSVFGARLICEDCGGFFGAKTWNSTNKYRRTIWQCNDKFKGENICTTPHLVEDDIKARFLTAYNSLLPSRDGMAEGAGKAETANILITDVWRNSIFQTADAETDKYTKANGGSGQFYDDFNDALASLYADQDFIEDLAEIYSLQSEAETMIKDLAKHPKSFDEEYSDFKDCYNLFVKFTDMSLTGEGSLNSFTDDHNELDKEIAGKLKELDIYFD